MKITNKENAIQYVAKNISSLQVNAGMDIQFGFDIFESDFERQGNNLVLYFDDGIITLESFFAQGIENELPLFILEDGTVISGTDFLMSKHPDLDISSAAGPESIAGSGLNQYNDTNSAGILVEGVTGLDTLDTTTSMDTSSSTASPLSIQNAGRSESSQFFFSSNRGGTVSSQAPGNNDGNKTDPSTPGNETETTPVPVPGDYYGRAVLVIAPEGDGENLAGNPVDLREGTVVTSVLNPYGGKPFSDSYPESVTVTPASDAIAYRYNPATGKLEFFLSNPDSFTSQDSVSESFTITLPDGTSYQMQVVIASSQQQAQANTNDLPELDSDLVGDWVSSHGGINSAGGVLNIIGSGHADTIDLHSPLAATADLGNNSVHLVSGSVNVDASFVNPKTYGLNAQAGGSNTIFIAKDGTVTVTANSSFFAEDGTDERQLGMSAGMRATGDETSEAHNSITAHDVTINAKGGAASGMEAMQNGHNTVNATGDVTLTATAHNDEMVGNSYPEYGEGATGLFAIGNSSNTVSGKNVSITATSHLDNPNYALHYQNSGLLAAEGGKNTVIAEDKLSINIEADMTQANGIMTRHEGENHLHGGDVSINVANHSYKEHGSYGGYGIFNEGVTQVTADKDIQINISNTSQNSTEAVTSYSGKISLTAGQDIGIDLSSTAHKVYNENGDWEQSYGNGMITGINSYSTNMDITAGGNIDVSISSEGGYAFGLMAYSDEDQKINISGTNISINTESSRYEYSPDYTMPAGSSMGIQLSGQGEATIAARENLTLNVKTDGGQATGANLEQENVSLQGKNISINSQSLGFLDEHNGQYYYGDEAKGLVANMGNMSLSGANGNAANSISITATSDVYASGLSNYSATTTLNANTINIKAGNTFNPQASQGGMDYRNVTGVESYAGANTTLTGKTVGINIHAEGFDRQPYDYSTNAALAAFGGQNTINADTININASMESLAGTPQDLIGGINASHGGENIINIGKNLLVDVHGGIAHGMYSDTVSKNLIQGGDSGVTVIIKAQGLDNTDIEDWDPSSELSTTASMFAKDNAINEIRTGAGVDQVELTGDIITHGPDAKNIISTGEGNDIIMFNGKVLGTGTVIDGGDGYDIFVLKAENWDDFSDKYQNLFENNEIHGIESIQYIVGNENIGSMPEWLNQYCADNNIEAPSRYEEAISTFSFATESEDVTLDNLLSNLDAPQPAPVEQDSPQTLENVVPTYMEHSVFSSITAPVLDDSYDMQQFTLMMLNTN